MADTSFNLDVSYSQIAIFDSALSQPFNDWTNEHVCQGFAWRKGSVSFRTLLESGLHKVEVAVTENEDRLSDSVIRAIEVPFTVPESGDIEVASISDGVHLQLPSGNYALKVEFVDKYVDGLPLVKIRLHKKEGVTKFEVLVADNELCVPDELITDALPA